MRYVIADYDENERRRLAALAAVLDPYTFFQLRQIGIQPDWHSIEIGAGTGTVSQWLADQCDRGQVLCTDLKTDFIDKLDHPRLRTERLDITQTPPYAERFDLAVVRAVHHHIPDRDAAARNLVQMVRPGGHILYIEPDLHPAFCDDHPVWKHIWQAVFQWGERRDIDYYTGRRVAGQLASMGMEIVSVRGETPVFNGSESAGPVRDLFRMTLDIVLPKLVSDGFLSRSDCDEARALFDNPDVWLMSFCFFATHARKPAQ